MGTEPGEDGLGQAGIRDSGPSHRLLCPVEPLLSFHPPVNLCMRLFVQHCLQQWKSGNNLMGD